MPSPFDRYRDYVAALERRGERLPVNQYGDLNFTKIGNECGNRRQWFSESADKIFGDAGKTLKQVIADDCKRLGTEFLTPKNADDVLIKATETSNRENSKLRRQLDQKIKEVEVLREENHRLLEENRNLKISASEASEQKDELLDTGRSFSWL